MQITSRYIPAIFLLALCQQTVLLGNTIEDSLLVIAESGINKEAALAYKELAKLSAPKDLTRHIAYAKKGIRLARQIDDKLLEGNLFMNMGVAYDIHDQTHQAIIHYDTAKQIFDQLDDVDDWLASLHINYGAAYYYANLKSTALKHWLEAYDKSVKDASNVEYALILNNISTIYEELGKFEEAIEYYSRSAAIKKERGDTLAFLTTLMNLGRLHGMIHQIDTSLKLLEDAQNGFIDLGNERKTDQQVNVQNVDIYRAQVLLENKRENEAAEIIFPVMDAGMPTHRSSRRIEGFMVAGDVAMATHKYDLAARYYDSAQHIVHLSGVTFDEERLFERASQAQIKIGNATKAYEMLSATVGVMKEKMQGDRLQLEQEMQVKFNTLQKEQENLVLQSESNLKDLRIARFRRNLALALIGLILITAFAIQVYVNRRKIQRLNRDLAQQKEIISTSLKEKEILLKEIHHRVKNNLQVVSSLLGIQSRRIQNEAAVDALKEGRSRVQSMSLIHQNLYSKDNLTGIEIRDYFKKLAENIFLTYNLSPEKIKLTSDIEQLVLDVDTVIPLGLIMNELISNALKYAFPTGEGKIHVTIQENDEGLLLQVRDDGVGISDPQNIQENESFGYDLINSFVEKLDGELTITVKNGTEISTLLRTYQKAA